MQAMKFLKGPNPWFNQQVCTMVLNPDTIIFPDPSITKLLAELKLPLPNSSLLKAVWVSELANNIQGFASCKSSFSSARQMHDGSQIIAFGFEEEEIARVALESALWIAKVSNQLSTQIDKNNPLNIASYLRTLGHKVRLGPSTHAIWQAAVDKAIPVWKLSDCSLLQLGMGHHQKKVWTAETDRTTLLAENIAQDKNWTRQMLELIGVPVPSGRVVVSKEDAWIAAQEIGLPVVVKPQFGSQGNGVSINLHSETQVLQAFDNANAFECSVVVENFKEGGDYRILVIGEKMIAASHREPAQVIGDGVSSVDLLVAKVNSDPRRAESHAGVLSPIPLDSISLSVLETQSLTLESIPEKNRTVLIRRNANLSTGGTAKDVTELVHPEVVLLAISAAKQVGLDIAGVDIITSDISKPLSETNGAVVEVNAGPGLRMHLEPSEGMGRPVGNAIIEMLYPKPNLAFIPLIAVVSNKGQTNISALLVQKAKQNYGSAGLINHNGLFVDADKIAAKGPHAGCDLLKLLQHPQLKSLVVDFSWNEFVQDGLGLAAFSLIICADAPNHGVFTQSELLQELRHALSSNGKLLIPQELAFTAPALVSFWSKTILCCYGSWNQCLKFLSLRPQALVHIQDSKLSVYQGEVRIAELPIAKELELLSALELAAEYFYEENGK